MFRRKDENTPDFSIDPNAPVSTSNSSPSNGSASANGSSSAPAAVAAAAAHSYAPATPRTSEPARSSAPAPLSTFRPTPVADLARPSRSADARTSAGNDRPQTAVKANRRVLTVGNDILLKGEIATCDRLVIEGRVEAKLNDVHTVEIAECGSFKGTAEVEEAEISGLFEGDLIVRNRIVIYATGEVRGNISYGEIEIERGGRLTGQIKTVAAGANAGKAAPRFEETKAPRKEAPVAA